MKHRPLLTALAAVLMLLMACTQTPDPPNSTSTPGQESFPKVELIANDTHWDNNSIALWWNDPDIEVIQWVVERSIYQDGPWKVISVKRPIELLSLEEPPVGYARYWDSGLPPDARYYYRIYACIEEGQTDYSNVVGVTVPGFMPGLPPPISTPETVTAPC